MPKIPIAQQRVVSDRLGFINPGTQIGEALQDVGRKVSSTTGLVSQIIDDGNDHFARTAAAMAAADLESAREDIQSSELDPVKMQDRFKEVSEQIHDGFAKQVKGNSASLIFGELTSLSGQQSQTRMDFAVRERVSDGVNAGLLTQQGLAIDEYASALSQNDANDALARLNMSIDHAVDGGFMSQVQSVKFKQATLNAALNARGPAQLDKAASNAVDALITDVEIGKLTPTEGNELIDFMDVGPLRDETRKRYNERINIRNKRIAVDLDEWQAGTQREIGNSITVNGDIPHVGEGGTPIPQTEILEAEKALQAWQQGVLPDLDLAVDAQVIEAYSQEDPKLIAALPPGWQFKVRPKTKQTARQLQVEFDAATRGEEFPYVTKGMAAFDDKARAYGIDNVTMRHRYRVAMRFLGQDGTEDDWLQLMEDLAIHEDFKLVVNWGWDKALGAGKITPAMVDAAIDDPDEDLTDLGILYANRAGVFDQTPAQERQYMRIGLALQGVEAALGGIEDAIGE